MPTPCKCRKTRARHRLQAHGCWERGEKNVMSKHPMNVFIRMRLKQKSWEVISFSRLFLWLKWVYNFLCVVLYTPNPSCPVDTTLNLNSLAILASNIMVLFNTKKGIKFPLTSGEESFIQKPRTCWCARWGLMLNCIMRGHPVHKAVILRGGRSAARWRWGRTNKGGEPLD